MNSNRRINDPFHNPFHNRHCVPVHSRLDEMQTLTQMVWLNDRVADPQSTTSEPFQHWARAVAALGALLLFVLVSATFLFR
jgi:hypothetical protein